MNQKKKKERRKRICDNCAHLNSVHRKGAILFYCGHPDCYCSKFIRDMT